MSSKEIGGDGVFMLVLSGVIFASLEEKARGSGGCGGAGGGWGLACGGGKACGATTACCVGFEGTCGTVVPGLGLATGVVVI